MIHIEDKLKINQSQRFNKNRIVHIILKRDQEELKMLSLWALIIVLFVGEW